MPGALHRAPSSSRACRPKASADAPPERTTLALPAGRVVRSEPVGQRTPTETLFGIVSAFVQQPTWSQAELARKLETTTETVRKKLVEMQAAGFTFEREDDHPHVYWSVTRNWMPGAVAFTAEETEDLLRLLLRTPESELRDRVMGALQERLGGLARSYAAELAGAEIHRTPRAEPAETLFARIEDAAARRTALWMRYFATSRGDESVRHVSVHRIDVAARTHFIGTCHRSGELRRFRMSNVLDARLDANEPFRPAARDDVDRFGEETLAGFRGEGAPVPCAFFVRDPEAIWVTRNLPDDRIRAERRTGGTRFSIETSAVIVLARFVVGLGRAATVETPELQAQVHDLARGALG